MALKIGDKFEALRDTRSGDVQVGTIYTIARYYGDDPTEPEFRDDAGDWNAAVSPGGDLYPDGFRIVE